MSEDKITRASKKIESLRKIITNIIWMAIIIVLLATLGRYLIAKDTHQYKKISQSSKKPITQTLPWNEVEKSIASAITETRKSTEAFARNELNEWTNSLMKRVDESFLDWYFSYWTQQILGLEGLWQYGVNYFFDNEPTATEKLTQKIQEEFSKRVLRPQIAELELERIVRDTANHYIVQLRNNLKTIPSTYKIPRADWERYMEGIALTTAGTEGNRETPVTLKALTASGAGGAVLLAAKMKVFIGKLTSKVAAKFSGKAASKMAMKTGGKVSAKVGGKFLGPIVGIAVLIWDLWDHNKTTAENRPILRQAISDYFDELKNILMNDPEAGIMTTFNDLEKQIFTLIQGNKSS